MEEKARQYYDKVLQNYKEQRDFDDDGYEVYAQRLLEVIYKKKLPNEELQLRNSVFFGLLQDWIKSKRKFILNDFTNEMNQRYSKRKRRGVYNFVFGVHIECSSNASFPFKHQFSIKDTSFKIVSQKTANRLTQGNITNELSDLYRRKRYEKVWIERVLGHKYIYFHASTTSIDEIVAANKIISLFSLFNASVTIAQERHSRTLFTSGAIKSRKPIQTPYLLHWLEAKNLFEATLVILGEEIEIQEAKLTFTDNPRKMKSFKRYLAILNKQNPTPIETRIKDVILEFDRSLGTTDPNLRMLGMWKCLEIASRMSDGSTRKYGEIIDIIRRYHDSEVVDEKAKLVLEARNAYVHQSMSLSYDNRDKYLRWLQDFVNAYLSLLMWMRLNHIGKDDLSQIDELFDFYQRSDDDLRIAMRLLQARVKDKKKYTAALEKRLNKEQDKS